MSDKGILGGNISNAIDVHQEALHLSPEPKVMFILFLMKGHKKFSVIENARTLARPLGNGAFSGVSGRSVRQTSVTISASSATPSWFWSIDDKVG